jgi:thiol-disulfide isomerase/thioredoxin
MKKHLLTLFIAFSLQAQAQLWNIQLDKDPTTLGSGLAGVIWTGTEFWCAAWATADIYVADANGNALSPASFTIPGVSGTRSMTTDGIHIYIGTAATSIYKVDPITKTLTSTISTSVPACRYLTFDPTLDNGNGGFWTGAYASDIVAVSMTGATLTSISATTHGLSGIYGMAFDGYSTGGPYLWAYDQGGNGSDIIQLSITGTQTGINFDANTLGAGGGTAGGLFICNNFVTGTNSVIGINQGTSLFALELADPPTDDPILTAIDIDAYVVNPSNVDIKGTITNGGLNTITSIDVKWSDGINTYTDNLTGLNIAMNGIYNFTHSTQLNVSSANTSSLTIWIEHPADLDTSNNTLMASVAGVTYIPTKRVVFEEATGTWCGWCPRGAVGLETLAQNYPGSAIGIAVHNGDNMTVAAYDGGMNVGGYPSGHVDRAILDVDPGQFVSYYSDRINVISPVDISATAIFDPATRNIDINLSAEFVATLSGDYRFNAVILEDEVGPFSQANYYSGGGAGPLVSPISGFDWAAATDPVNVIFDHVARAILGGFDGTANSIPSAITAGSIHTFNYTHSLPATENENKVHVVGMVIDNVSGEILNAVSVALSGFTPASWDCVNNACIDPGTGLGQYTSVGTCTAVCNTTSIQENNTSEFNIYPNPVKDVLTIDGIYNSVNIYDVFGKLVLTSQTQKTIDVSNLSNGVYMLEINTEQAVKTKKITVAK